MTELEYIDATNLAKLRIANELLGQVFSGLDSPEKERCREIGEAVREMIGGLEKMVREHKRRTPKDG